MQYRLEKNGDLFIESIDPVIFTKIAHYLQGLLAQLLSDKPSILKHHLSPQCPQDPAFDSYWQDYGAPEITHLLKTHHQHLLSDLDHSNESLHHSDSDQKRIVIPKKHRISWLRILNATRLCLHAQFSFDEKEISTGEAHPSRNNDPNYREGLFMMQLFSFLEQLLIEAEEIDTIEKEEGKIVDPCKEE